MDVTSDGSTFDISHTLYADLDTNNNGSIGGINYLDDADNDGILDLFDTDDHDSVDSEVGVDDAGAMGKLKGCDLIYLHFLLSFTHALDHRPRY